MFFSNADKVCCYEIFVVRASRSDLKNDSNSRPAVLCNGPGGPPSPRLNLWMRTAGVAVSIGTATPATQVTQAETRACQCIMMKSAINLKTKAPRAKTNLNKQALLPGQASFAMDSELTRHLDRTGSPLVCMMGPGLVLHWLA